MTPLPLIIRVYVSLDKESNSLSNLFSCDIREPENVIIGDLIKMAVDRFNELFRDEPQLSASSASSPSSPSELIQFRRNFEIYELRPSKKNGLAKLDLPPISSQVKVSDTYITQFSLIFKEEDLIRRKIKLRREDSSTVCRRCVIF